MEREIFCDDGVVTSLDECDQGRGSAARVIVVMLIRTRSAWSASDAIVGHILLLSDRNSRFCLRLASPNDAYIKRGRRMSCVRIAGSDRKVKTVQRAPPPRDCESGAREPGDQIGSLRLSWPDPALVPPHYGQGPWRIYAVVASRGPIFRTERTSAANRRVMARVFTLGPWFCAWSRWLTAVVMTFCVVGWVATWVTLAAL